LGRLLAVASIVILSAIAAADANAIAIRNAYFDASLSGTFTSSAQATDPDCTPPMTANVTDRVVYSSVRPTRTAVSLDLDSNGPVFAGSVGRLMSIRVTATRNSGLSSSGQVPACRPPGPSDAPPDCGTKSRTLRGSVIGGNRGIQLGFAFLRPRGRVDFFNDFFAACPRAPGQAWFGKMIVRTTPVSRSQIFNRHRRTLVVTMRRSGRTTSQQGRPTSVVNFSEKTTIRLKRVG
jgi:hypothetical protein